MSDLVRTYRPLLVLIAVLVVAFGWSWGSSTRLDTMLMVGTVGLVAVSLGLVYGQAGALSLAQAAFAALGAYATAILTRGYGLPIALGLVIAILLPAAVAFVLARLVIRLSHLALAVATLLLGEVFIFFVKRGGEFTGGFIGISGIPTPGFATSRLGAALVAWAMVLIAVAIVVHVVNSAEGRALRTCATDPLLAKSLGINVTARMSWIFALGGGIAGSAGWLYAHTRTFLSPESLPPLLSLTVLIAVIIGGKRTVLGPILGAAVLELLRRYIPAAEVEGIFYGGMLILILVLAPNGLLGTDWSRVWRRVTPGAGNGSGGGPGPDPEATASTVTEEVRS